MKNAFLIGEKIYLRPYEKSDGATMAGYLNDAEIARTLQIRRPVTITAEEELLETHQKNERHLILGIALKSDDRLIGGIGLHHIDAISRHASIGLFIGAKDEWGKGRATEAMKLIMQYGFDGLNLNRLWLRVHEDNTRAEGIYLRLGFKREGTQRQDIYREGRYFDTHLMGILRDEWMAIAK